MKKNILVLVLFMFGGFLSTAVLAIDLPPPPPPPLKEQRVLSNIANLSLFNPPKLGNYSVASDANNVLIGTVDSLLALNEPSTPNAPIVLTGHGRVFVLDAQTGAFKHLLKASDSSFLNKFGTSVALSGAYAVVGAPGHPFSGTDAGSAYIFNLVTGKEIRKIAPGTLQPGDAFGKSVSIFGNKVLVGAPGRDTEYGQDRGSAFLYDLDTGNLLAEYKSNRFSSELNLGSSVTLSSRYAAISNVLVNTMPMVNGAGVVYLFDLQTGNRLEPFNPSYTYPGNLNTHLGMNYGTALALTDNALVIGSQTPRLEDGAASTAWILDTSTGNLANSSTSISVPNSPNNSLPNISSYLALVAYGLKIDGDKVINTSLKVQPQGQVDLVFFSETAIPGTSLKLSNNTALINQTILFGAQVVAFNPTGTVSFMNVTTGIPYSMGSSTLGGETPDANVKFGSIARYFTGPGLYKVFAAYSGDKRNPPSISPTVDILVKLHDTVTSFTVNPNPVFVNEPCQIAITVTGNSPTGWVSVIDLTTSNTLGVLNLSGLKDTQVLYLNTTFPVLGNHKIAVSYSGDSNNAPSVAAQQNLSVLSSTTLNLSTSAIAAKVGESITYTASINSALGKPAGSIDFMDGTKRLASENIGSSGVVTWTQLFTSSGTVNLRAVYFGSSTHAKSESRVIPIQIANEKAAIVLTVNPKSALINQAVELKATVTGYKPTGTVVFKDGSLTLGTVNLSSVGSATLIKKFTTAGLKNIKAEYLGNAPNLTAVSSVVPLLIK
jgi:hypothetical protein